MHLQANIVVEDETNNTNEIEKSQQQIQPISSFTNLLVKELTEENINMDQNDKYL